MRADRFSKSDVACEDESLLSVPPSDELSCADKAGSSILVTSCEFEATLTVSFLLFIGSSHEYGLDSPGFKRFQE